MNRINTFRAAALVLSAISPLRAWSADSQGANTISVIPSSGDAVKPGDIIYFRSDAPIFTESVGFAGDTPSTTIYCAPANSRFEVQSITPATSVPTSGPAAA